MHGLDPPRRSRSPPSKEGDRSAVACATRITALNISFISGPEQLPYSTNMRSEHCRDARDRAYVHASHPAVVAAAITGDAAIRMVNETRPHPPLAFLLFVFFTSFRFAFPLARFLFLPYRSPFLISLCARFSAGRLTFCVPTKMTARGEHPADRVSREINLRDESSCRERTISRPSTTPVPSRRSR